MVTTITEIGGSVAAAKGFLANGILVKIKKTRKTPDLMLLYSETEANAAAVYTQNKVKGSPLKLTQKHLATGKVRALIANSGNANTCNADGDEKAYEMCDLAASALGVRPNDVAVASTGVIGLPLDISPIKKGMKKLVGGLSKDGGTLAAAAIMTTDTVKKEVAVSFELDGKECRMGAIAKGSGMIHPNMATMLCFITTDVAISAEMLDKALKADVVDSFNMLSIDGDTSTNDMVLLFANGMAGNNEITEEGDAYEIFCAALKFVTQKLVRMLAKDGEGACHLIECRVVGAPDKDAARKVAKSVITSSLFKSAVFGRDANWGRILCAVGYSEADIDVEKIDIALESKEGVVQVCKNGAGVVFSEPAALKILGEKEIYVNINLNDGAEKATAYGCDLTIDYVKINSDYRS